jgi:hypothetical protein
MPAFSATKAAAIKPSRVAIVPVEAFAADWPSRPTAPVAVGLRRLCDGDLQAARAGASKFVLKIYADDKGAIRDMPAANDAFNDALMRHAVARAATDPNDATKSYFPMAEETVRMALTADGIARIWDEYVIMTRTTGVDFSKATDEDLMRLSRSLISGAVAQLDDEKQAEVRKLAAWCLEQIVSAGLEPEEDDDDGVYRVRAV